jgi:hypothetical protein
MPAFYSANVRQFLAHEEDLIIGRQTTVTQQGLSELSTEQLDARGANSSRFYGTYYKDFPLRVGMCFWNTRFRGAVRGSMR